ncbi:E3 ubiquitin-protein ligase RFI2-like isoform X2 [Primulina eburnea]|uniref:E3 ubiquitin-protein ligase RFI2-like isoform X2 n=1 Tax=Primulina eburnea TaxID=1245227 RepID=UPI003C6C664E
MMRTQILSVPLFGTWERLFRGFAILVQTEAQINLNLSEDCIGSAFNIKGAMQCPNCRKIEKGQWLYANGSRPLPEFIMEDWAHDEDLYDLGYSEMSFGVHWCPFSGLTRIPASFE